MVCLEISPPLLRISTVDIRKRGGEYNHKIIFAGSSNGRTADSESVNLGSSPSPAAAKISFI